MYSLTEDKMVIGIFTSVAGYFSPIASMCAMVIIFIFIDFVTGVWADKQRCIKEKRHFVFKSQKMWRTVYKLGFTLIAIMMAYSMNEHIFTFVDTKLPNIIAGFICGVEFWSFCENAYDISDAKVFRFMKTLFKKKISKIDDDIAQTIEDATKDKENNKA